MRGLARLDRIKSGIEASAPTADTFQLVIDINLGFAGRGNRHFGKIGLQYCLDRLRCPVARDSYLHRAGLVNRHLELQRVFPRRQPFACKRRRTGRLVIAVDIHLGTGRVGIDLQYAIGRLQSHRQLFLGVAYLKLSHCRLM